MDKLPTVDEAVYMIIEDIMKKEPNQGMAEFLCIALLAGFKKTDDLIRVVQGSNTPEQTMEVIKQATALMSYDKTKPENY